MSPSAPNSPRGTHAAGDHAGQLAREAAQLVADLRERVGICSLDSFPACYTATLRDGERTYRASAMGPALDYVGDHGKAERAVIDGIVADVVAQALAARKGCG